LLRVIFIITSFVILFLLIVMLILKLSYISCIFILDLYKHDLIQPKNK
jgi:hypothetical protein